MERMWGGSLSGVDDEAPGESRAGSGLEAVSM